MKFRVFIFLSFLVLVGCMARTGQEVLRAPAAPAQGRSDALFSLAAQAASSAQTISELPLKLPLNPKSVRFAVIGDTGTGENPEFEMAREMEATAR